MVIRVVCETEIDMDINTDGDKYISIYFLSLTEAFPLVLLLHFFISRCFNKYFF